MTTLHASILALICAASGFACGYFAYRVKIRTRLQALENIAVLSKQRLMMNRHDRRKADALAQKQLKSKQPYRRGQA